MSEGCAYGVPLYRIESALSADGLAEFNAFFAGQTGAICDGTAQCPGAHGLVVYQYDWDRFLVHYMRGV